MSSPDPSLILYSFAEIEETYKIKVRTLRQLYATGRLEVVKLGTKNYVALATLQELVNNNKAKKND